MAPREQSTRRTPETRAYRIRAPSPTRTAAILDGGDGSTIDGDAGPSGPCHPDPANYDIPGNHCDDDGDGQVDNVLTCDSALPLPDGISFAKAIGLCQVASGADTKWGVLSATFVNGYKVTTAPNATQHALLQKFGDVVKPREGLTLGVLSSGTAAEQDADNGPFFKGTKNGMQPGQATGAVPPGYPEKTQGCGNGLTSDAHDVIDLRLEVRVPKNAQGFSLDMDFFSGEWPDFTCSDFDDQTIVVLSSNAFNGGTPANIALDAASHAVSVNSPFVDRCTPNVTTGCAGSPLGVPTGPTSISTCVAGESEPSGDGLRKPGQVLQRDERGRRRDGMAHDARAGAARGGHHSGRDDLGHRGRELRFERPSRRLPVAHRGDDARDRTRAVASDLRILFACGGSRITG